MQQRSQADFIVQSNNYQLQKYACYFVAMQSINHYSFTKIVLQITRTESLHA